MNMHVLAGDALAENFSKADIEGAVAVCRECLIEGDVKAENTNDFWKIRANFIKTVYGENVDKYYETVAGEFQKLSNLAPATQVNLWFEYELFCQTNMWFCLYLLSETKATIYRVAPFVRKNDEIWKGFGNLSKEELQKCFAQRIEFEKDDVLLGVNLWKAYQNSDYEKLEKLSATNSPCFPFLKEVCLAEIEKGFRPKNILREITGNGATDFSEIFTEFSQRTGVYGFGDAQVKRILQEI
ncbi:MAG: DUF1835 domain-containing protein [Pyrinomonadaceae bacterium]|nr:DUF1835 domain-containing protein [Pyrinomonadaceae bacterium]